MASCAGHDTDTWHVSINDLPDEILIKIFSLMSFSELMYVVQQVCSRWKRLSRDAGLWTEKEYEIRKRHYYDEELYNWVDGVTDQEAIQTFCKTPKLRKLRMHRPVTNRVLHTLYGRCHHLTELHIHFSQKLSYSVLKNLVEQCPKIHTLGIPMEMLKSEKFVETVLRLQHLRVLKLEGYLSDMFWNSWDDTTQSFTESPLLLRPLGDGFPQLSEVDFTYIPIDMDDLRHFLNAKNTTLKSIHIKWTEAGGRCILPLLTVCADSLERLELYEYDIVDGNEEREAFTALGRLKKLQELKMSVSCPSPDSVNLAFKSGGLQKLKLLHLTPESDVDNDSMITICHSCPALRELSIDVHVLESNAAFSQIHCLKNLEKLHVSGLSRVAGPLIQYFTRLPKLHTLSLQNQKFKLLEPGVSSILDLSGLHCLILNHSTVTEIPFDKFPNKLVQLRELHIDQCCGNIKAITMLSQQMPNLQIRGNFQLESK